MWFGKILGTDFETTGSDTLYYEICDSCTHEPTGSPTIEPTGVPSVEPTPAPTNEPTVEPTIAPSVEPTLPPTNLPTVEPTLGPTGTPTVEPTAAPTPKPSTAPSSAPTGKPTQGPTENPSVPPTIAPTDTPSYEPSSAPSVDPTQNPTPSPTVTDAPTTDPTTSPTASPSASPSYHPTSTDAPTVDPTTTPTASPSAAPTHHPTSTERPTMNPTTSPTEAPTEDPTSMPTNDPTESPTNAPTTTEAPTADPTSTPTNVPTPSPTNLPTIGPTISPTNLPTTTNEPTTDPTSDPTMSPTSDPTLDPTSNPTLAPTSNPTLNPTSDPTAERRLYDFSQWAMTPNILLIVTENSWADFSAFETPNIDDFLEESYNFSDFRSQSSRGSLVTGHWTPKLGMGMVLEACDEGHLPFDVPTYAEYLKLKGYNNHYYGKWNLGADTWHATPIGRGWDSFYGCLNRPDGLERGDGGSWAKLEVSCPSNVKPMKTLKAQSYPQCLMKCYGSQVAAFEGSMCSCYSHAVCTEPSKHSFVYSRTSQKDVIIDWWKGSKPAHPGVGMTGDDLIMQKVLPHLQELKAEAKWTMTVSFAAPGNGYAPFNEITESCKKYFDEKTRYFNFQRGLACQWIWDNDKKVGIVIDEIKKTDLWSDTIVVLTNFNSNDERTIFSLGGGALPAQFVRSTNEDLHSVVDITPTIMAIAGFSDGDLKNAKLDGVNVVDINKATAMVHESIYGAGKETKSKENNHADLSKCGSKQSFTSLLGLRYNAPWLDDDLSSVRK